MFRWRFGDRKQLEPLQSALQKPYSADNIHFKNANVHMADLSTVGSYFIPNTVYLEYRAIPRVKNYTPIGISRHYRNFLKKLFLRTIISTYWDLKILNLFIYSQYILSLPAPLIWWWGNETRHGNLINAPVSLTMFLQFSCSNKIVSSWSLIPLSTVMLCNKLQPSIGDVTLVGNLKLNLAPMHC